MPDAPEPRPQRYAVIGAGFRSEVYIRGLLTGYRDRAELVGLVEPNPVRAAYSVAMAEALGIRNLPVVHPDQLEQFIADNRVDRVIVTSRDATHAEMIERSLHAGARVITEKPLTMSVEGANRITRAVDATGLDVVVTFNYRYSPRNTALKELVLSGAIGTPTSVHFEWMLDTAHGADYFRRWHRDKANSGGLFIHKAAHHFDLVNWWLADTPRRVFASGGLRFYGEGNARARGLAEPLPRGSMDASAHDPFALDLRRDERLRAMYFDAEAADGYRRDQNPFGPGITIEDNLSAVVDYAGGASMSYSLNAHSPWEGYRVAINGTEGRVELDVVERSAITLDSEGEVPVDPSAIDIGGALDPVRPLGDRLVVQRHWGRAREVPIDNGDGGHGGGDERLLADLFAGAGAGAAGATPADPLGRAAGLADGLAAIAVGLAANRSLESGQAVAIDALGFTHDL